MVLSPLLVAGVTLGALGAGFVSYGIATAPARKACILGPRGLARQRARAEGGLFAAAEPLLGWLGTRLSGLLPASLEKRVDRKLVRAGEWLGLLPEEYVVLLVGASLLGAIAGAIFAEYNHTGDLPILGGAVMGWCILQGKIDGVITKRAQDITRGLPYVIDLLALGMSAGLDFPGAVKHVVARSSDPTDALTRELERVLQELGLGHTRKHVLLALAERNEIHAATEFVYAVVQADERGNPLADVLATQALVARQKRSAQAEEGTARAQQAMSLPLTLMAASTMILLIVPMLLKVLDMFTRYL